MSTPAQNPRPSAARTTTRIAGSAPACVDGGRQVVPAPHRQRVDRREIDHHLGDPVRHAHLDAHCSPAIHLAPLTARTRSFVSFGRYNDRN